jgi:hypothetical protein
MCNVCIAKFTNSCLELSRGRNRDIRSRQQKCKWPAITHRVAEACTSPKMKCKTGPEHVHMKWREASQFSMSNCDWRDTMELAKLKVKTSMLFLAIRGRENFHRIASSPSARVLQVESSSIPKRGELALSLFPHPRKEAVKIRIGSSSSSATPPRHQKLSELVYVGWKRRISSLTMLQRAIFFCMRGQESAFPFVTHFAFTFFSSFSARDGGRREKTGTRRREENVQLQLRIRNERAVCECSIAFWCLATST